MDGGFNLTTIESFADVLLKGNERFWRPLGIHAQPLLVSMDTGGWASPTTHKRTGRPNRILKRSRHDARQYEKKYGSSVATTGNPMQGPCCVLFHSGGAPSTAFVLGVLIGVIRGS